MSDDTTSDDTTSDDITSDELSEYLGALERDACWRVDAVLKEGAREKTERVCFQGVNGAELGPFVRKRIACEPEEGAAYECLCAAQREGRRFLHLPRVYDCHRADGDLVVIMEYVQGETLASAVDRRGASAELAASVFPQLCDAASELHEGFEAPIVHRDLKPSNVMVSRDGTALTVIDFGIARIWKEGAEEDTRHLGTRAYAPPEQFGFGQTDERTDVYALGMLLYFCLTGWAPTSEARSFGFADERVPEPLRQVIARASAFDPQERYASAAEAKRAFLAAWDEVRGREADVAEAASTELTAEVALAKGRAAATSPKGREQRLAQSTAQRLLSRVPPLLGTVWDVLLALFALLMVFTGISLVVDPLAGSALAQESLVHRALDVACMVLLMFLPAIFFLRDRRPLRRIFPQRREMRVRDELALVVGAAVACILLMTLWEAMGL